MAGRLARLKSWARAWAGRGVRAEGLYALWKAVRDEWWPWLLGFLKLPGAFLTGGFSWLEWGSVPVALTLGLAFYASARFVSVTRGLPEAALPLPPKTLPAKEPPTLAPGGESPERQLSREDILKGFAEAGGRLTALGDRLDAIEAALAGLKQTAAALRAVGGDHESRLAGLERGPGSVRDDVWWLIDLLVTRQRKAHLLRLLDYYSSVEAKIDRMTGNKLDDAGVIREVDDAKSSISLELVNVLSYSRDVLDSKNREIEHQVNYEARKHGLDAESQAWLVTERRFRLLGRLLHDVSNELNGADLRPTTWLYQRAANEAEGRDQKRKN
jgi:hypothetical protein